jgi:hypothetical protein
MMDKMNRVEFIWNLLSFVCQNIDEKYCWKGKLPDWLYNKNFKPIRDVILVFVRMPYPMRKGGHWYCRTEKWDAEMKNLISEVERLN